MILGRNSTGLTLRPVAVQPASRFVGHTGVMTPVLAFLEGPDLIIVALVVLVLFGGSQLPKLARSLGQAKKELDAGLREGAGDEPVASDQSKN